MNAHFEDEERRAAKKLTVSNGNKEKLIVNKLKNEVIEKVDGLLCQGGQECAKHLIYEV